MVGFLIKSKQENVSMMMNVQQTKPALKTAAQTLATMTLVVKELYAKLQTTFQSADAQRTGEAILIWNVLNVGSFEL